MGFYLLTILGVYLTQPIKLFFTFNNNVLSLTKKQVYNVLSIYQEKFKLLNS